MDGAQAIDSLRKDRSRPSRRLRLAALLLPIALYGGLLALLLARLAYDQGDQGPIYTLDDVYIHMALAKNLALHGVWGVTPWETTNASSSPLWVALLALGFALLGPQPWLALLLATLASLLAIGVSWRAVAPRADSAAPPGRQRLELGIALATGLAVVAFASLPALTVQGMEHPLHTALLLGAALLLSRLVADRTAGPVLPFLVLVALLPLLRYESLWLVMLGSALLALRRRDGLAALTLLCGLGPVAGFGLWALAQGQTFLPAAILTKSVGPALLAGDDLHLLVARFTWHPLQRLSGVPLLLVLWIAADLILLRGLIERRAGILARRELVLLGLFAAGTWIHATFATFGWGGRYEAYLIVLGMVALAAWLLQSGAAGDLTAARARLGPSGMAGALLLLAALLHSGVERTLAAMHNVAVASREVRDRDMVAADFFAQTYPRQAVMAMNIGAIAWRGEPHLTDVLALGTTGMLRLFLRGELDAAGIDRIARARGVKVAAIFDDWFHDWTGGGHLDWIAVAMIDPHAGRDLRYRLYARDAAEAARLAQRLRSFAIPPIFRTTVTLLAPWN